LGSKSLPDRVDDALESLDFLYLPSADVAKDLAFYTRVLGGEVVFAIERFGTRVAEVSLGREGPRLLLAEHLEGGAPVLVHRVPDLEATLESLEARGVRIEARFEIPPGPAAEFRSPGGQRLAVYELTRADRLGSLPGRVDFQPAP
jgi:catechol 2,3-dioxygenase-like lactoylglutathione lyase family enzyme